MIPKGDETYETTQLELCPWNAANQGYTPVWEVTIGNKMTLLKSKTTC